VPAAYSLDLRERVVGTLGGGVSRRGAAGVFKVSVSTAIRWTKRLATTGRCAPLPSGYRSRTSAERFARRQPARIGARRSSP
jgi:transposase